MTQQLAEKVAKNSAINLGGTIITRASRFLFFLLMARLLGPSDFGFFSIAFSLFLISQVVCESGFYSVFQRFVPVYLARGEAGKAKGLITFALAVSLPLSLLVLALVFLAPPDWLAKLGRDPRIEPYIYIVFFALPFYLLAELVSYLAMSRNRFFYKVVIYAARFIIASLAVFILSMLGRTQQALTWAFGAGALVAAVLSLIFLFRLVADIFSSRQRWEVAQWLKFMAPVLIMALMTVLTGQIDRIFLGMMRSAREAGIYNAASRVVLQGTIVYITVVQGFVPLMSELFHSKRLEELKELYRRITWWCLLLYLPLPICLIVFGKEILTIFGPGFQAGYPVLIICTIYPVLLSLTGPAGYLLRMANRQQMEATICLVCAVISIGLNYWLIPIWGMTGAALAFAVSCTTVALWEALQLFLYSGIHAVSRSFLGPLILGVALTILATELKIWSLWAALALIVGGYLVSMFLFFLNKEDRQILAVFTGRLKRTVYAHISL